MKPIEIFKAGTHTDMAGVTRAFAAADLVAAAAAYDPAIHEAPIVVGHPRTDAPAYGWVGGLDAAHGRLVAHPQQVEPAFAEAVQAGRYKKISASFYPPDSKANPAPGAWYLRHVGFLGASAPAVKGLRPVGFADDGEGDVVTVEFSAVSDSIVAGFIRRLRDWLIVNEGLDTADQVAPGFMIDALNSEAAAEAVAPAAPGFSESKQTEPFRAEKETPMACAHDGPSFAETKLSRLLNRLIDRNKGERASVVQRMARAAGITPGTVDQILNGEIARPPDKRLAGFARVLGVSIDTLKATLPKEVNMAEDDFAAREAALEEAATKFAEEQAAFAAERCRHAAGAALDGLIAEGKVLPAEKGPLAAFMAGLDDGEAVAFGEGEKKTPSAFFADFLASLPKRVELAELAAGEGAGAGSARAANFAAPPGYKIDAEGLALRQRAVAYRDAHPEISFAEALAAIGA